MSTTKSFAGASYNLPLNREPRSSGWGTEVSNFLIALADNAIPKTGGSYTLSAELNLGATYGVVTPYVKSAGSNLSTAGVVRLARTEAIGWRNQANGANLLLEVNSSNQLTFNSVVLATAGAASIVNADISASAAIALSKLAAVTAGYVVLGSAGNVATATAITGDVTIDSSGVTTIGAGAVDNAMLAGSIAYSKLVLTGAIVNDDLAGSIAYGKLVLTDSIVNADISSSAAIALSKLATTTAGYIPVGASGTGVPTYVAVSGDATLASTGALTLATVAINKGGTGETTANAALNALLPSQTTHANKVLTSDGTDTSWTAVATTVTTTRGDLIRRGASADERFAAVTDNRVVRGDGTDVVLGQIDDPAFFTSGSNATSSVSGTVPNYEAGSFTVSASGPYAAGNVTCYYTKVGKAVTLTFTGRRTTGSSSATAITLDMTNLPTGFYPAVALRAGISVTDAGTDQTAPGLLNVTSAGNFTIERNFNTGAFTSTASTVGFYAFSVSYSIA